MSTNSPIVDVTMAKTQSDVYKQSDCWRFYWKTPIRCVQTVRLLTLLWKSPDLMSIKSPIVDVTTLWQSYLVIVGFLCSVRPHYLCSTRVSQACLTVGTDCCTVPRYYGKRFSHITWITQDNILQKIKQYRRWSTAEKFSKYVATRWAASTLNAHIPSFSCKSFQVTSRGFNYFFLMSRSNDFTKFPPKQDKRTVSAFLGILINENGCAVVRLTWSQFFGGSKECSFLFIYNTS